MSNLSEISVLSSAAIAPSTADRASAFSNVAEYLLQEKPARAPALLLHDAEHTYGELDAAAHRIAAHLVQAGARPGDRVILAADNSFFWVASYLGIMRAALICVPLPVRITPEELGYILRLTEPVFAMAQSSFATQHAMELDSVPLIVDDDIAPASSVQATMLGSLYAAGSTALPATNADDLAALMFTSGSTGRPRGVMLSHANIIANTESIIRCLALTRMDRVMTVLPFHYCFGASLLHTHLRLGGTLVIDSRFRYPEIVLQRMRETACTGFAGVPSHFQILLRRSSLPTTKFPALRYVQQAGGALAPALVRELRRALPTQQIFLMYGQTEATARLSCLPPEFLDSKPGSVGKGIPGVELRVVNDSGNDVAPGQIGEIIARGGSVARGYWREPEESAQRFRHGWLHTRDLATVDRDGFIYIVDRADDFLKCGGKRVSCTRIEQQLLEFDEILEAAVVGISDEVLGEAVKAFVVPRRVQARGFENAVLRFCREHFASELLPRQIVALDALPKNSAGKILKRALRKGSEKTRSPQEHLAAGRAQA